MIKTTVNEDGSTSVEVITDHPILDNKRKKTGEMQTRTWFCGNAAQALKHVPTWNHEKLPASERMSKGDASALRDRLHEIRKQRKS